jgi:hypothetical protein
MSLVFLPFALIGCVVVAALFVFMRWAAEEADEGLSEVAKYIFFAGLCAIALAGPFQAASPWTLALPFHPALLYGVSGLAWIGVLAILAAKKASKTPGWVFGIVVGACVLPVGACVLLWLLFQPEHAGRGRISPTLTYEILFTHPGFGSTQYKYVIYRNPRYVSWIRRKAAEDEMPCTPSDIRDDPWRLQPGPNEHTVVVSCDVFQVWRDRKVYSTEISLR